jgi:Phage integrase, N-terminal SAM-like domain
MAHVRGPGTPTKKGIPWDVCWEDETGRARSKRFYDQQKAIKEAGRIEDSLRRGENTDPRAGRLTFKAVAEDWLATPQQARPPTRAKYRKLLENHAFPTFGARRIAAITAADVGRFVESLYTITNGKPRRAAGVEWSCPGLTDRYWRAEHNTWG